MLFPLLQKNKQKADVILLRSEYHRFSHKHKCCPKLLCTLKYHAGIVTVLNHLDHKIAIFCHVLCNKYELTPSGKWSHKARYHECAQQY